LAFRKALKQLWFGTDQMCGKLVQAAIPDWLASLERNDGPVSNEVKTKLLQISAATIDRVLKPCRAQYKKGKCGTKPGRMLRNEIPIRPGIWDEQRPGFAEIDTVAHCGGSLEGQFVWSLTLTDIATTWTENRATWNHGSVSVLEQLQDIERHLPFPLLGLDMDNGSEFLNHYLLKYFLEQHPRATSFQLTRSREYMKDDQAHVEQKNWAFPRQLFGYERFEFLELVALINDLYINEWSLLKNHFCPTLKVKKRIFLKTRCRRLYGAPKTPYQRVLESADVSEQNKEALRAVHASLDPFTLKNVVHRKQKAIFQLLKKLRLERTQGRLVGKGVLPYSPPEVADSPSSRVVNE
jgi:hypothetical protein